MIERNLLDQTKDLRGPQRMVQSNFGMLTGDQRRIAGQGLSQNNRVGRKAIQDDAQPIYRDQPQPAIQLPNYAPGGKFSQGSGSIEYTTDMGMPANPYRDRLARLPDLSHPANAAIRQQFQGNNPADAQPIQDRNNRHFDVSGPIPNRVDRGGQQILRRRIKIKKTEVFQTLTEILTAIACQATNLNMAAEAALACNNLCMAEGWV
jgi:hypothetical protein